MNLVNILVVDDSPLARARLKKLFEGGGHTVVGDAGNGRQALELYKSLNPELVTQGYILSDRSGEKLLGEIIGHDPGAKIIMVSGSNDETLEERVIRAGAKAFVRKFSVQNDLLGVIDEVMSEQ